MHSERNVCTEKVVDRNDKKQLHNLCGENRIDSRSPVKRQSLIHRIYMAVPRIDTDALAEKAKMCKFNLVKGIRQH